jgi:hypothetical protein
MNKIRFSTEPKKSKNLIFADKHCRQTLQTNTADKHCRQTLQTNTADKHCRQTLQANTNREPAVTQ